MDGDVRFADIRKRLEAHGWALARISGSHHVFTGKDRPTISIPVHKGKVKRVYDDQVNKAIRRLSEGQGR
jgi:predicted RNA binding protein YcfA (HicA-like mRNA interferase family)